MNLLIYLFLFYFESFYLKCSFLGLKNFYAVLPSTFLSVFFFFFLSICFSDFQTFGLFLYFITLCSNDFAPLDGLSLFRFNPPTIR